MTGLLTRPVRPYMFSAVIETRPAAARISTIAPET
jgi:hypothetical protein